MRLLWLVFQLAACMASNIILDNDTVKHTFDIKYTVFGDVDLDAVFPSDFSNRFGALDAVGFRVCRQPKTKVRQLDTGLSSEQEQDVAEAVKTVTKFVKDVDVGTANLDNYWSYMLTKKGLVQAHLSVRDMKKLYISQEFVLGVPQKDSVFDYEIGDDGTLALFEMWDNGTTCDLTLAPRKVKIRYVCDAAHVDAPQIMSVAEVQSCVYETLVGLPELCSLPSFVPMVRDHASVECDRFVRDLFVPDTDRLEIIELEKMQWMVAFGRGVYLAQLNAYPHMVVVCTEDRTLDAMAYRVAQQVVRNLDRVPPPAWETQCSSDFAMAFDVYDVNGLRMTTVVLQPEIHDNGLYAMPYAISEDPFDTNYLMYNNRWTHLGLF